ncbi:hypothetical protein EYF80_015127 [Liparis tanakae]|uniref:Uncharacterized protein n=1 Tax=Liparis tanakae TaxID=230148 RepID=A0A4Z2I9M2_9TELE|nr:hypothetical protein EYF80_015127 [Liparis tanakae]
MLDLGLQRMLFRLVLSEPAMSSAPSLPDSGAPGSSPTKPTRRRRAETSAPSLSREGSHEELPVSLPPRGCITGAERTSGAIVSARRRADLCMPVPHMVMWQAPRRLHSSEDTHSTLTPDGWPWALGRTLT